MVTIILIATVLVLLFKSMEDLHYSVDLLKKYDPEVEVSRTAAASYNIIKAIRN